MKRDSSGQSRLLKEIFGPNFDQDKIKILSSKDNKISEAVLTYAKPLLENCDSYQHVERAINFAIFVWNLCLLPEDERRGFYKELLDVIGGDNLEDRALCAKLIRTFTQRKAEMFPDDKRFIINYKLTDKGKEKNLTVTAVFLEKEE